MVFEAALQSPWYLSNVNGDKVGHLGEVLAQFAELMKMSESQESEKASEIHLAKVGHKRGSRTWTKVDHQRATGSINENNINLACLFSIVVAFGVLWKQGNRILHHQHSAWIPFNFLLPSLIPPCQREQGKLGPGVQVDQLRVGCSTSYLCF